MNRREALRLRTYRRREFWAAVAVGVLGMVLTLSIWFTVDGTP